MMPNTLYLVRGLPGAGKTSFVRNLTSVLSNVIWSLRNFEADQYFYDSDGNYNFDIEKLHAAHMQCQTKTSKAMDDLVQCIFVSNTFTTEKELKPYLQLAEEKGYQVVSLVVENRHGGKSVHNVPEEALTRMKNRFTFNL